MNDVQKGVDGPQGHLEMKHESAERRVQRAKDVLMRQTKQSSSAADRAKYRERTVNNIPHKRASGWWFWSSNQGNRGDRR